jgi:hypothetical protein
VKFYAKDSLFFSEISEELAPLNASVNVGHLSYVETVKGVIKQRWIVVEDSLAPRELITEFYKKDLSHFVQKNSGHFSQDLRRAGGLIENPQEYFQSGHSLIHHGPVTSTQIYFSETDDKTQLFDQIAQFLEPIRSTPTKDAANAAIEELYMNATLDAPKEARRKGIPFQNTRCELHLGYDQDTLQISCTDPFGSLDLKKLFGRLYEVYQKGAGEAINLSGTGGAGIGCYLLFEHCRSLIFGVRPGVQTKVTCLIPLTMSQRERAKLKKSIHGFEVR